MTTAPQVDAATLESMPGTPMIGPARRGVEEWVHPVTGQWHRLDGPARADEDQDSWYCLGELHRVGGPAVYDKDGGGDQRWYQRGVFHRLDGPAWVTGFSSLARDLWYVRGMRVSDDDVAALEVLRADGELVMLELVLEHWAFHAGREPLAPIARAVRAAHM